MSNCGGVVLFLLLVSPFSLVPASECGSDGRVVIPIGLFASSDVLRTSSALPAAELAIQQINEDSSILPGYCLKGVVYDTNCTVSNAIEDAFSYKLRTTTKLNVTGRVAPPLVIIGGGCPTKTETIAKLSKFFYTLEITYSLSNYVEDEDVYHMMPLQTYNTFALHNFIEWIGVKHSTGFVEDLTEFHGYPLSRLNHLDSDDTWQRLLLCDVNKCPETGIRTHLLNASRTVFSLEGHVDILQDAACQAVQLGAVYPRKMWFIYGMEGGEWWEWDGVASHTNCSKEDMKRFLDRAITVVPNFDGEMERGQPKGQEFAEAYNNLKNISRRHIHVHEPLIYDAVWVAAKTMNKLSKYLITSSGRFVQHLMQDVLERYYYTGLTGRIAFYKQIHLFRPAYRFLALQYHLLPDGAIKLIPVANITLNLTNHTADIAFLDGHTMESVFPEGVPEPPKTIILVVSWKASGVIMAFAILGVIFALVCSVLTCVLWNRREMKVTSPRLNVVIAVGAIVWYISVAVKVIPTEDITTATVLCEVWRWGWNIGASLFFVPLLLKNWRVYYIFHNPTKHKIAITDWKLFLALAVFILFDIILLTISTAVPDTRLNAQFNYSAPFEKYIECITGHSYISLIILACYKLVLAIIGSVLAVQNRKVKILELREAKVVGVATYAFLFATTVTVATIFAVKDTRVRAIVVSVEGLCTVTFLLAIFFVPTLCRALRAAAGKEEGTEGSTTVTEHSTVDGLDNLQKYTLAAMQSEIDALREELKKSDKALQNHTTGITTTDQGVALTAYQTKRTLDDMHMHSPFDIGTIKDGGGNLDTTC